MTGTDIGRRATAAVHGARPWVEPAARAGYAAKGVVYLIVGLLAAQAALGRGAVGDSGDAFDVILRQPLGRALLGLVALGLVCYVGWRLVTAIADTEDKGNEPKGLALRAAYAGRALLYAGLALEAARLAMGGGGSGGSGDQSAEHWSARLLEVPGGGVLLALVGAGIAAYGAYQFVRAASPGVRKHLDLSSLDADSAHWAVRTSRFGIAARGAIFLMIGWLVAKAALSDRAEQAGSTGDALRAFQTGQSPWVLGVVALGLVAYALYQFLNARYRVVRT